MGVFTSKTNAQEIYERTGHKRFYIKADELIELSDETIATCTQWGIGNISTFVENVNKMNNGFRIENK